MNFDMCTSYRYAAVGRGGDVRIFLCLSLVICNLALSAPNSEADSIVHVRPAVSLSLRGGCVPESSAVRALRSDRRTPELMSDDAAWRKLNENASHRKRYQLSEGSAKADACNDANVEGHGWSPLMLAAARGRAAECRRLVQEGASVNSMGCHNATALHCAAQRGKVATCRLLIEMGADVSARTRPGEFSALHLAAMRGFGATALQLAQLGCNISELSASGDTAAAIAEEAGHTELSRALRSFMDRSERRQQASQQRPAHQHDPHRLKPPSMSADEGGRFFDGRANFRAAEAVAVRDGEGNSTLWATEAVRSLSSLSQQAQTKADADAGREGWRPKRPRPDGDSEDGEEDDDDEEEGEEGEGGARGANRKAAVEDNRSAAWGRGGEEQRRERGAAPGLPVQHREWPTRVQAAERPRFDKGTLVRNKLVLRNLPYNIEEAEVRALFDKADLSQPAHIHTARFTKASHFTVAFITCHSDAEAAAAIIALDRAAVPDPLQPSVLRMASTAKFFEREKRAFQPDASGADSCPSQPARRLDHHQHSEHLDQHAQLLCPALASSHAGHPLMQTEPPRGVAGLAPAHAHVRAGRPDESRMGHAPAWLRASAPASLPSPRPPAPLPPPHPPSAPVRPAAAANTARGALAHTIQAAAPAAFAPGAGRGRGGVVKQAARGSEMRQFGGWRGGLGREDVRRQGGGPQGGGEWRASRPYSTPAGGGGGGRGGGEAKEEDAKDQGWDA